MQPQTYHTATVDGYDLEPEKSQCSNCVLLVDGILMMNCKKYPDGFNPDFWNNEIECPDRQEKKDCRIPIRTETKNHC